MQHFDQAGTPVGCRFVRHPAAAKTPRKVIGEFPDFPFGDAQHFGDFRKGAPRLKGGKAADDRAMFLPVFLKNEFHHVVFAVVRKINVNVRQFVQRHALFVQEAPEIKIETDRANATDAEAIADQAVRRTAPRDPFDAATPAFLQHVPGDQEIILIANIGNDAEFFHHLRLEIVARVSRNVRAGRATPAGKEIPWLSNRQAE